MKILNPLQHLNINEID